MAKLREHLAGRFLAAAVSASIAVLVASPAASHPYHFDPGNEIPCLEWPGPFSACIPKALETVREKKLLGAAPALRKLIHYPRPEIRKMARETATAIGLTNLPAFDPLQSLPYFQEDLTRIAALFPAPPDAPWVRVTVPPGTRLYYRFQLRKDFAVDPPREVSGWLLDRNDEELHLLDFTGFDRIVPARGATVESRPLGDELGSVPDGLVMNTLLLPAAWALARGDRATAVTLAIPMFPARSDLWGVVSEARRHICEGISARIGWAFRVDRDFEQALSLARLYGEPKCYLGKWAIELAEELADPVKTPPDLYLITKKEWQARRTTMSRAEQIDYLIALLRAKLPPGAYVERPAPRADWIYVEPEEELKDLALEPADFPPLVRYLADERKVPGPLQSETLDLWSMRDRIMSSTVGRIVNGSVTKLAGVQLFDAEAYGKADAARRADMEAVVLHWAADPRRMSQTDIALAHLETYAPADGAWIMAAQTLEQARDPRVLPYLLAKGDSDPKWRERGVERLYRFDDEQAVPFVRRWLAEANAEWDRLDEAGKLESVAWCAGCNMRLFEALLLLRRGDRKNLEGLETIRSVLERDQQGFEYAVAWEDLLRLKRPEADRLLAGILERPSIFENLGGANGYLACRIWMLRRREFVDVLQQRLASTAMKGMGYSIWGQKVDPTEGDRVADLLASWAERAKADAPTKYRFDEPADVRADKRAKLSTWLEAQYAIAAAGGADEISAHACNQHCGPSMPDLGPVP